MLPIQTRRGYVLLISCLPALLVDPRDQYPNQAVKIEKHPDSPTEYVCTQQNTATIDSRISPSPKNTDTINTVTRNIDAALADRDLQ